MAAGRQRRQGRNRKVPPHRASPSAAATTAHTHEHHHRRGDQASAGEEGCQEGRLAAHGFLSAILNGRPTPPRPPLSSWGAESACSGHLGTGAAGGELGVVVVTVERRLTLAQRRGRRRCHGGDAPPS